MTVRIHAKLQTQEWPQAVEAEGATLAQAVRKAAYKLGLGPGKTMARNRVGPSEYAWNWSGHTIHVRVAPNRQSLSNAYRKRKLVTVTLSPNAIETLKRLAAHYPNGQSGVIEQLLTEASHVPQS